jgi:hypothetical protein
MTTFAGADSMRADALSGVEHRAPNRVEAGESDSPAQSGPRRSGRRAALSPRPISTAPHARVPEVGWNMLHALYLRPLRHIRTDMNSAYPQSKVPFAFVERESLTLQLNANCRARE